MLKESSFNTGTTEINYAEGPHSGPPLVLLHGLPGRWQEFLPIMPALSLLWHVHALDFRGQGNSGRTPGHYLARYYGVDVEQFLRHQLDEPAVLFGMSAGGAVALAVAAECPELVRAIVVGDSPIDKEALVAWMTSEGFKYWFSALRELAGLDLSVGELCRRIADIPVQAPGQDARISAGGRQRPRTIFKTQGRDTMQTEKKTSSPSKGMKGKYGRLALLVLALLVVFVIASSAVVWNRFSPQFVLVWLLSVYIFIGIIESLRSLARRLLPRSRSSVPPPARTG